VALQCLPWKRENLRPDARNAPFAVASQGSFAGHWPPSELYCGGYLRRSFYGLPGWLFPSKGRSKRLLRAGYLVALLALAYLQRPIHHWRPLHSNRHAFVICR